MRILKINHKLNCCDKCLSSLLTWKVCLKQYVGQTFQEFRYRWNNYSNNGSNYQEFCTPAQQHLYEHFPEDVRFCFLEYVSIILIGLTDPLNLNSLMKENYWRSTQNTMRP